MTGGSACALRALHTPCQCEMEITGNPARLDKDGCTVWVEELTIAIDCDDCDAFFKKTKPDIIAVRRCDEIDEWLVFEMSQKSKEYAGTQVQAGFEMITADDRFRVEIDAVRAFFVVGHTRRSDRQVLQKVGQLHLGSRLVRPRVVESGFVLTCPTSTSAAGTDA